MYPKLTTAPALKLSAFRFSIDHDLRSTSRLNGVTDNQKIHTPWAGQVKVTDATLRVRDSGGPGPSVLYLNGCYADQNSWHRVLSELRGHDLRHIRFDARGRGASSTSKNYSFCACLTDITSVLNARNVTHPILVGWSYGATLAAYWAEKNPGRVSGIVAVDGALPFGLTGKHGQDEIRRLFKRLAWIFPIASRFGLAGKMSAEQHAQINIEANEKSAFCAPILSALRCPVLYVLGTGGHLGASHLIMEQGRAKIHPICKTTPNLQVFAKVKSNHASILRRDAPMVATAIGRLAELTKSRAELKERS